MKQTLLQIVARRERLIVQAATQRTALAETIEPWRAPLARVDQGLAVLRFLKRNPAWVVGGGVVLATFKLGVAMKWMRRGWGTWTAIQILRGK